MDTNEILAGLRPHQIEPAAQLLEILRDRNALDCSDTGTGKSFVAAWCARRLGAPTLAVVPKISKTAWTRAAEHFGDTISVVGYEELRTGRTPYGTWENTPPPGFRSERYYKCDCCQLVVDFDNYTPCYTHPFGFHCIATKKKAWEYGKFNFAPQVKFVIFDEVHRSNGIDSLNADMLIAAREQNIRTLALSATAAATPLEFRALGYLLDLHSLVNFYGWTRRFGCGKIAGMPGWHWVCGEDKKQALMERLHSEIFPAHGIRLRRANIPGFPTCTITPQLFDLEQLDKLNGLYAEMQSATQKLDERRKLDASPDMGATKHLRQRQHIELLKVPVAVELTNDAVAKGKSVVLFCNFSQTVDELSRRLKCGYVIDGRPQAFGRDDVMNAFAMDKTRVVIVNSEAGGVSVSFKDERGEFPREGIVFPPVSARTLLQVVGRLPRDGAKSHSNYTIILAANSIEEKIFKNLNLKIQRIETLNDGDLLL